MLISIHLLTHSLRTTGASLQHQTLVDAKASAEWGINPEWSLIAMMPFGKPTAPAGPKPAQMKKPIEERLKVFGA